MTGMTSLQTLERRILALEARLADVEAEAGCGDTLYELYRASARADLRAAKILQRLEIQDISEEEIDAALDEEWNLGNLASRSHRAVLVQCGGQPVGGVGHDQVCARALE